jgi:putative oxidoreductase
MRARLETIAASVWVQFPLRWLLGGMFLVAAAPKIMDPAAFSMAVDNYRFLPTPLVNLWALFLPWVELFVGVILVMGPGGKRPLDRLTEAAALLSALMYLSFLIGLITALVRGLDIGCGCFRPDGTDSITWLYPVRDLSFLAASLVVVFFHDAMRRGAER